MTSTSPEAAEEAHSHAAQAIFLQKRFTALRQSIPDGVVQTVRFRVDDLDVLMIHSNDLSISWSQVEPALQASQLLVPQHHHRSTCALCCVSWEPQYFQFKWSVLKYWGKTIFENGFCLCWPHGLWFSVQTRQGFFEWRFEAMYKIVPMIMIMMTVCIPFLSLISFRCRFKYPEFSSKPSDQ